MSERVPAEERMLAAQGYMKVSDLMRLRIIARQHRCTVSEIVRWALNDWLEERDFDGLMPISKRGGWRRSEDE